MGSYEETLTEIHQIPRQIKDKSLTKMRRLLGLLGHPENDIPKIHVAGTNGKGSTCKVMADVLIKSGYKVGLFTSPYIYDFRERIQINANLIPKNALISYYKKIKEKVILLEQEGFAPPTEFEVITVMGLMHFSSNNVDVAIIEVGIGGLYDATNVIDPILSVITSITKDHTAQLGNTIESIASHKAGIIKGAPTISTSQLPEVRSVLLDKAKEMKSNLEVLQSKQVNFVRYKDGKQHVYYDFLDHPINVDLSLLGIHQMLNAGTAILALHRLKALGFHKITEEKIQQSLSTVSWPGRMEMISKNPLIFIDGAHNLDGAISLKESIELYFPKRKVILILGFLKDKEVRPIMNVLMKNTKRTFFITPNDPRAQSGEDLKVISGNQEASEAVVSIKEAVAKAIALYEEDDLILAAGSLYTVAEVKEVFKYSLKP